MANSYNSNPIILDTDISTGWRANQTLNTGNLPTNAQQFSGAVARQWGIRVVKLVLQSAGTTVAGTVSIVDPSDSTQLYPLIGVAATAGANGTILKDDDLSALNITWRDFKVTGLTATVTRLLIYYR